MGTNRVWCVIVETHGGIESAFPMQIQEGVDAWAFSRHVVQNQGVITESDGVPDNIQCSAWRCKKAHLLSDGKVQEMREIIGSIDFEKSGDAIQLPPGHRMGELKKADGFEDFDLEKEVLIVRVYNPKNKRKHGQRVGERYSDGEDLTNSEVATKRAKVTASEQLADDLGREAVAKLWDAAWGCDVGWFQRRNVERDNTLAATYKVDVPAKCWIMQSKCTGVVLTGLGDGVLIRDAYSTALEDLFKLAGLPFSNLFSSSGENQCLKNPFLNEDAKKRSSGGFILTGVPGIGKSIWLRLLLVLRLQAKLPTWFLPTVHSLYYFDEKGGTFYSPRESHEQIFRATFEKDMTAWVLVDSTLELITVPDVYYDSRAFIVQTPSPRQERLEWATKQVPTARQFFLEPWTLGELITGRCVSPAKSENELTDFYELYGPAARKAYANTSDAQERFANHAVQQLTLETLKSLMAEATNTLSRGRQQVTYEIITIKPKRKDRECYDMQIITPYIQRKVIDRLKKESRRAAIDLFKLFNTNSYTKVSAGDLMEDAIHSMLSNGGEWVVYKLDKQAPKRARGRAGKTNVKTVGDSSDGGEVAGAVVWKPARDLPSSKRYMRISYDKAEIRNSNAKGFEAQPARDFEWHSGIQLNDMQTGYYVPKFTNQATFDSMFFTRGANKLKPHAIIFQSAVSKSHGINILGLQQFKDLGISTIELVMLIRPKEPDPSASTEPNPSASTKPNPDDSTEFNPGDSMADKLAKFKVVSTEGADALIKEKYVHFVDF